MKLLFALIAVFIVSGAMAQDYDGNDVSFAQKKKLAGLKTLTIADSGWVPIMPKKKRDWPNSTPYCAWAVTITIATAVWRPPGRVCH